MDDKEFTKHYHATYDFIMGFLVKRLHDRPLAEDITQDTYLRAWKYRNSYKPGFPYRAWLIRLAINCVAAHYEKNKRHDVPKDEAEQIFDTPSLEEQTIVAQAKESLQKLKPIYCDIATLFYVEEYTYPEIAAELHIRLDTITNRMHWAREYLHRMHYH
jgi:RNA polymerase sigma-70 factor (ECF subfamily)